MLKAYLAYLRDNPEKKWFKAKLFGWGWTPARPQGWIVIALYIGGLIWLFRDSTKISPPVGEWPMEILLPVVIMTAVVIVICYITGEKPKWQWGIPDKYKQ